MKFTIQFRRFWICLIPVVLIVAGLFSPVSPMRAQLSSGRAQAGPCPDTDQACPIGVLLRLAEDSSVQSAQGFFAAQGVQVLGYLSQIGVWHVEPLLPEDGAALAQRLAADPDVLWAEPNGLLSIAALEPNDDYYASLQANLRRIRMPDAWEITTGVSLAIAVVDTGIDLDHPDLKAKVWVNPGEAPGNGVDDDGNGYIDDVQGWDFLHADALPQDDHGHGSHVSGIAAAHTDNGEGIAGVSWGARLMALKALDNLGNGSYEDISEAILYAADNGAKAINLSIGGEEESQTVEAAVNFAHSRGCLVAAAAGNTAGAVLFPASLPDVLAVAATDNNDLPASFSNRGPEVDLAAPGVSVISANAFDSYRVLSGTSMSTAHVSGLAALIWSLDGDLTADQVAEILTSTAQDVWSPGYDILTGWGRIDAFAALNSLMETHQVYIPSVYRYPEPVIFVVYLPHLAAGVGGQK